MSGRSVESTYNFLVDAVLGSISAGARCFVHDAAVQNCIATQIYYTQSDNMLVLKSEIYNWPNINHSKEFFS